MQKGTCFSNLPATSPPEAARVRPRRPQQPLPSPPAQISANPPKCKGHRPHPSANLCSAKEASPAPAPGCLSMHSNGPCALCNFAWSEIVCDASTAPAVQLTAVAVSHDVHEVGCCAPSADDFQPNALSFVGSHPLPCHPPDDDSADMVGKVGRSHTQCHSET